MQTVRTKDGWVYVMCMKQKFWEELAQRVGHPELVGDERFATPAARRKHRPELTRALDEGMSKKTTAEWLEILTGHIPVAPINDLSQAFANPFMRTADMVRSVPHPAKPGFKMLANPLKIDGVRPSQAVCSALGADNKALLGTAHAKAAAE